MASPISQVLGILLALPASYRTLRSFTRGSVEVCCGAWLLLRYNGRSTIGRVSEITEMHLAHSASSVLRMLMCDVRCVDFEDEMRGQVLTVRRDSVAFEMLVCVEHASLLEVSCDESNANELTFEYVY